MTRNPNRKGKNPEKARPMLPKDRSLDVGPEVKRQTSTPLTLNPVHIAYDSSGPSSTHQSSLEVNISGLSAQDTSSSAGHSCPPNQQTDVEEEQMDLDDRLDPANRPLRPSSSHTVAPIGCTYEEWWKASTAPRAPSPSLEEPPSIPLRSSSRTPWRSRSLLAMASLRPKPSCGSMSSVLSSWNPFQLPGPSRTSFTDLFDIFQRGSREGMYTAALASNESSTSLLHDESTMTPRARSPEYLSPQSAILQAINEKRGEEETTKPTFRYTQPFDNLPSKPSDSPPKSTPGPNRHYKAFHNLPTPPWTDSQCSSTCSPAFPTTSCRTPFESIESRFSSTDFNPTDSDSKWLEPYTDTPSCPPLDTPKRRVACSSWTSTLTSEDDDSHLTAIKDVIARNMTPDWERFEEISCKFPPRMTPARAATPPAGFGRWAGYGRRLSTAVEEEEGEAGLEEKRRSLQLEREGAWWRNESTVERRNSVQERYPELSSGEWKGKRRGYPSDRGGLLYV